MMQAKMCDLFSDTAASRAHSHSPTMAVLRELTRCFLSFLLMVSVSCSGRGFHLVTERTELRRTSSRDHLREHRRVFNWSRHARALPGGKDLQGRGGSTADRGFDLVRTFFATSHTIASRADQMSSLTQFRVLNPLSLLLARDGHCLRQQGVDVDACRRDSARVVLYVHRGRRRCGMAHRPQPPISRSRSSAVRTSSSYPNADTWIWLRPPLRRCASPLAHLP